MTALGKKALLERLARDLVITPLLDKDKQLGESSIDLRLGREFIIAKHTRISSLNPIERTVLEKTLPLYQEKIKLKFGRPYILHPQEFVLASTLEFLALPRDLMAYVVGRSSWGRLGLIIATATMIDPLYRGVITLELVNVGRIPIHLYPCSRIAQIVLHNVSGPTDKEESSHKYQNSFEPSFSLIHRDKELSRLVDQPFTFAVGLTGLRGAGKSEIVNYLTADRDFRQFNISDIVREEAKEQGLVLDRATLQDFGDEMRDLDSRRNDDAIGGSYFARKLVAIVQQETTPSSRPVVITGIRHPGEVRFLRDTFRNFFLVGITADQGTRYSRRKDEGETETREEFDKKDLRDRGSSAQPMGQNIGGCLSLASEQGGFVIENESITKPQLRHQVDEILDQIYRQLQG